MAKLFIIADDFTGALDTGVQFAAHGAATRVVTRLDGGFALEGVQVLVLDAETRHLPAEEAYRVVHEAVSAAREAEVPYIYKKTDSGLRGNVGAELAAAMDALGVEGMPFIPELPSMHRVARGGVYYVDGVPVADSVFGRDPFEPVTSSSIGDIIARQTDKPVSVLGPGRGVPLMGIGAYDAETDEDLSRIGEELGLKGLRLSAGCAGFAAVLAGMLGLRGEPPRIPALPRSFFMVCGSINPVTRAQVVRAAEAGFTRVWMGGVLDGPASPRMILDANRQLEDVAVLPGEDRLRVSEELASAAKGFLDRGLNATLMCVGGDTLMALMRAVGVSALTPVCEMDKGVVLTSFDYAPAGGAQRTYYIMAKSGGFGDPGLLCRLADRLAGDIS